MKALKIKGKIEKSLRKVLKNDKYLLEKDINERTIAHKLATYLQSEFRGYNVECEYNGNVLRDNGRKYIELLKYELQTLGDLSEKEKTIDKEIIERHVFPDIIIHKRGTADNFCIIEIKKSTSKISSDYDELKLKSYTSSEHENDLKYKLGVFIKFKAGVSEPTYDLRWYVDGIAISEEALTSILSLL
jgi:hypothetical protein